MTRGGYPRRGAEPKTRCSGRSRRPNRLVRVGMSARRGARVRRRWRATSWPGSPAADAAQRRVSGPLLRADGQIIDFSGTYVAGARQKVWAPSNCRAPFWPAEALALHSVRRRRRTVVARRASDRAIACVPQRSTMPARERAPVGLVHETRVARGRDAVNCPSGADLAQSAICSPRSNSDPGSLRVTACFASLRLVTAPLRSWLVPTLPAGRLSAA